MALKGPISKFTSLAIVDDNPNNLGSGFYPPQLTTEQINNIPADNLQAGNLVYNTSLGKLCIYNGDTDDGRSGWETVESRTGVQKPAFIILARSTPYTLVAETNDAGPDGQQINMFQLKKYSDGNNEIETINRARYFEHSDTNYIKYTGTAKTSFIFTVNITLKKTSNDVGNLGDQHLYVNFWVRDSIPNPYNSDNVHNRGSSTVVLLKQDQVQGAIFTGYVELNPNDLFAIGLSRDNSINTGITVQILNYVISVVEA